MTAKHMFVIVFFFSFHKFRLLTSYQKQYLENVIFMELYYKIVFSL